MSTHHDRVLRYFDACTRQSADEIASHFCDDAVVYDTNHAPVSGAQAIGNFYAKVRQRWNGASWHIDTFIEGPAEAASEWTMLVRVDERQVAVRGAEHYEFHDGLIRQIRQYWSYNADNVETGLKNYPYRHDDRFTGTDR